MPRISDTARRLSRLALVVMLGWSGLNLQRQLTDSANLLPLLSAWANPRAQSRLLFPGTSDDLLRAVDAVLPRDAVVLLATPGTDVRHREYTTYHRALYLLTPRQVWWMAPAPSDGTWESRWWISVPLTPEAAQAVAAEKRATVWIASGFTPAATMGEPIISDSDGVLIGLPGGGQAARESAPAPAVHEPGDFLPMRILAALVVIEALGYAVVRAVARIGYRPGRIESLALAWVFGMGLTSLGMGALNALGLTLDRQVAGLTLFAGLLAGGWIAGRTRRAGGAPWVGRFPRLFRAPRESAQWGAGRALVWLLLAMLSLQVALVAVTQAGQPLHVWDSWVTWAMKARAIFLDGRISPAVYDDPSRAVTHLDYPLLVPLIEAWLYQWVGAADDRMAGIAVVCSYVALILIGFAVMRRRGSTTLVALAAAAVIACMRLVAGMAGEGLADIPMSLLAAVAALYLSGWLNSGSAGELAIAVIAGGLMPWTKREGWVLLLALAAAAVFAARGNRRARIAAVGLALGAVALSGPWWAFISTQGIANTDFLPLSWSAGQANAGRIFFVIWTELQSMMSGDWNFVWPLTALLAVALVAMKVPVEPAARLLPLAALIYLALMSLTYVFSAYVPYQQHVLTSSYRLMAHVAPLMVVWVAGWTAP
ncbi:MAG: glycosyltransferase family 39 protein [Chloroflexi bacterium]|nr:glycosyltransferase family 39 protein [Chloroflexota bacterium]